MVQMSWRVAQAVTETRKGSLAVIRQRSDGSKHDGETADGSVGNSRELKSVGMDQRTLGKRRTKTCMQMRDSQTI
jgi:hypothetical protein